MRIDVKLEELAQTFSPGFGEVQTASDGGYERGYEEGFSQGESAGYNSGYAQGESAGYSKGYGEGEQHGFAFADSIVERTITEFVNHRVTKIGAYAFARHSGLLKVDIPNVERVETYGFNYCTGLTEIELPKCRYIAGQSFNSCNKLEKVVAPTCEQIGGHAFTASKLSCLILGGDKVCFLDNAAAIETGPMKNGTGFVYVPKALVEQYRSAPSWSTYTSQIRAIEDYPEICG